MLFAPNYVRFCVLVGFGWLGGRLLGKSCSLGIICFLAVGFLHTR